MSDWRKDFPAFDQKINGHPLIYLDSAASSLKPRQVVDRLSQYYLYESSNVHRGAHYLSDRGTVHYEEARQKVKKFINASANEEIVFTKGTTESINLVAQSWGRTNLQEGDEILLTEMEHHANIVPWQILAEEKGFKIKVIPVTEQGALDLSSLSLLMTQKTKLLAVTHCSNTLGTINDVKSLISQVRLSNSDIKVLVDGAQAVCCQRVDVQDIDCDFYAFSGHKIWGPYGIGILYGRKDLLQEMPPYQGGGSMIAEVSFSKTTFADTPTKFEAGTPPIAGAIGLGSAIDYIDNIGIDAIHHHGQELLKQATEGLSQVEGLKVIGVASEKSSVLSFIVEGVHPGDLGALLDEQGIAVRVGHHCTQPLMAKLGFSGTVRASFSIYNNESDVEKLVQGVKKSVELLR